MSNRMGHCLSGAIAGLLATVPMTVVMIVGKRLLPQRSQDPLPPVQITQNALRAVRVDDEVSREEEIALTAVNHFGFGASTGALYGALCPPRSVADALKSGCIYGLGVWSCSYLGWLPASGLYRSAVNETPERNTLMIIAHLVWGAGLGVATCFLSEPEPAIKRLAVHVEDQPVESGERSGVSPRVPRFCSGKLTREMTERKAAEENSGRFPEEATGRRVSEENA